MGGSALLARFKLTLACFEKDDELLALQMIRVALQADWLLTGLTLLVSHFDAAELLLVRFERFATACLSGLPKALRHLIRESSSTFAICRLGRALFSW